MRRAALALTLVLVVVAAGCGGDDELGSGDLMWEKKPRVFTNANLPDDRVLAGTVRNDSLEPVLLVARDLGVRTPGGDEMESAAVFAPPSSAASSRRTVVTRFPRASSSVSGYGHVSSRATPPRSPCRGANRASRPPWWTTARARSRFPATDPRRGCENRPRMPPQLARTSFAERVERLERESLSPLATRSYPARRDVEEPDSDHRTPFQRDRDRIVHSKAFRRLKHKTQVFIAPEGDHYRTRLTHTLEASGIARNVARALSLNEDLTEAISLGHDLGHPPFGHIGEEVLDACVRERWGSGFRHNEHSLRVVERIERLNLTEQVRDGIRHHTGPHTPATLEGRIVKLVDRIAYINHDIDDALRAGILRFEDLPREEIELLGSTGSERIETLVVDLLGRSEAAGDIVQGEEVGGAMLRLRSFMFERVYLGPDAQLEKPRIERLLRTLFEEYAATPPPAVVEGASEQERVVDWLAGMTDRFAIRAFADMSMPQGF